MEIGVLVQSLPKTGEPASWCGSELDTDPKALPYRSQDRSLFTWDVYKFVELADGTYEMRKTATNLELPPTLVEPVDTNGDGMVDLVYRLLNDRNGRGRYENVAESDLGPYIAHNLTPAPDLLVSATNGLGAVAAWIHRPLSDNLASPSARFQWESSVGCDIPQDETFYSADHMRPRGQGHAFFTSVMWTVARFDQSNGIGADTNKTCYRYKDALLNTEGRGFQGFRLITADEQMHVAQGEDTSAMPGLSGCGSTCSPNNMVTTTEFYQEFPLTGLLKAITVANRVSGKPLRQTTNFWHVAPGGPRSSIVYASGTVVREYDASGPLARQTTTVSEVDLTSGDATRSCVVLIGATPDSTLRAQDQINLENREIVNDTAAQVWWLGRILSAETMSDFLSTPFSLNEACTVTGDGGCSATPPSCPTLTPSKNAKRRTTIYRWYDDTAPPGSRRMLQVKQINSISVPELNVPKPRPVNPGPVHPVVR